MMRVSTLCVLGSMLAALASSDAANAASSNHGGGSGTGKNQATTKGKVNVNEIPVTKKIDKSSPKLMMSTATTTNGKGVKTPTSSTITHRKAGKGQQ